MDWTPTASATKFELWMFLDEKGAGYVVCFGYLCAQLKIWHATSEEEEENREITHSLCCIVAQGVVQRGGNPHKKDQ